MKDTNKQKINPKFLTDKDDSSLTLSAVPLPAQIRRNSRSETTFNNRTVEDKDKDKDIYRDRKEGQEQNFKNNDKDKEFISNSNSPIKTTPIESSKLQFSTERRKHWRSPSNPIDFGINCTQNSSPFNKIRFSSSHSISNNNRSGANINMNASEFIKQNNNNTSEYSSCVSVVKTTPAEISLKQTPKTSILPRQTPRALELDFPFQINTTVNHSQKPPSSLLSLESESVSIEMTVKPTTITETLKQQKSKSLPLRPSLQAYETMLLACPLKSNFNFNINNQRNLSFPMLAELSISPVSSSSAPTSDFASTRRHIFAFNSSYCGVEFSNENTNSNDNNNNSFIATSLAHGHIDPLLSDEISLMSNCEQIKINDSNNTNNIKSTTNTNTSNSISLNTNNTVTFTRSCLVQVILRNPQDNHVAAIFVVKLDLADMPPETRTILRQKSYKTKCIDEDRTDCNCDCDRNQCNHQPKIRINSSTEDYLVKFIEIPLKRSSDPISGSSRQRIQLSGPIRLAYTFNRSNLRYSAPRNTDIYGVEAPQKTRTILQFPSKHQKYYTLRDCDLKKKPLSIDADRNNLNNQRSSSLPTDNSPTRSFQHGSLCL